MQTVPAPRHDEIGWGQHISEIACLAGAAVLIGLHLNRVFAAQLQWSWPAVLAAGCGAIFADFMSGLVHWFADTWFEETMPILGRRLLRPFRVHHINPDDFLRRSFIDTNGDVSMVMIPLLMSIYIFSLTSSFGQWCAVFLLSACIVAWPTNQVHQWAHMPDPPRTIGWLQSKGLLLSGADHRRHHEPPYVAYYCIATGWLNRPLTAIHFFRRLERLITRLTGLQPREDDTRFIHSVRQGRAHV
jgi:ubiquitin-conjugating enzyme E2 variant